jgi:DMSO/TMAO reductase YedYZ molybdopterin-dependent catalytic subunit
MMFGPTPPALTCGQVHGMVSCSEWTGVPLRPLLEEAGADLTASWILAEGADAAAMSRSVPMAKVISKPSESAARHYLRTSTWMRKTLDRLPQGLKR